MSDVLAAAGFAIVIVCVVIFWAACGVAGRAMAGTGRRIRYMDE